jgi:leucyl aminopeptidase (aminopeptidase T)
MMEGMRADYGEVDRISTLVWQMASAAREIRATNPAGTGIIASFSPSLKWLKTSGIISPHKWGNLPGGETFTTPERVDGTFVVDGVVGDYLCEKYGDLAGNPLTLRIVDSRLVEAHSENKALEDEFWSYCHADENSDRVGEFAIGTNIALQDVVGNILQDEKIPGVHIAFGNPYGAHTGADWYSSTHIDVVGRHFDIYIDGRQIMTSGAFLLDRLAPAVV